MTRSALLIRIGVAATVAAASIWSGAFWDACEAASLPVTVQTLSGLVEGANEQGVRVYRGIPFAAPPVGDLRWRDPQPVAAWTGVREARSFAPICPQMGESLPGAAPEPKSEDCLYLNVWAPA